MSDSLVRPLPLAPLVARLRTADEVAVRALVDDLLVRAEEVEPVVRALVPEEGRRERLDQEIAALLARWPDPSERPALFGVPVGVKDIIAVDGLATHAGSAVPAEAFAMPEASVVAHLREAGALVFGKTVTAEFASMPPGGTANPHHPRHTPGGSSSGSAAGVAAGTFPLSLGTQTGGSVNRPAAFCGIVGFKPSYGRIPTDGVLPHAISVDTLGLFAQDLEGVALAAPAVVEDWRGAVPPSASVAVVVPDGAYLEMTSEEGRRAFEDTVARLEQSGIRVVWASFLDDVEEVLARHQVLMDAEFAAEHRDRFARWGALYSGAAAGRIDAAATIPDAELEAGLAGREELRGRVAAFLDATGADVLICPSAVGPAPASLQTTGDPRMNAPWTHAGVPTVSLPAGTVGGLPVGLQVVGRFGADEELIGVAGILEGLASSDGT